MIDYSKPIGSVCSHCGCSSFYCAEVNNTACAFAPVIPVYAVIPEGERPVWRARNGCNCYCPGNMGCRHCFLVDNPRTEHRS